jgi:hypothetical protein
MLCGQCVFLEATSFRRDVCVKDDSTNNGVLVLVLTNLNTGSRALADASRSPARTIGVTVLSMDLTR